MYQQSPARLASRANALFSFVLASVVAAALPGQQLEPPTIAARLGFDSGYLANATESQVLLWSQDVSTGGDWVRVHCRDCNLPEGSELRLYGTTRPGWVQRHDAASLRDYRGWSCDLLGPTVRVELWGGANTAGNRVWIDGSDSTFFDTGVDSICDGTDDRVLSNDPRSCRLGSGCSAWLFSPYAVGTAGHCMSGGSTAGVILHFNTPPSSASGTPQPSHPDDQYALDTFLQFLDNGPGEDWSVMAAVRNSNTHLFPGQAQGSWYTLAAPPAAIAGDIRVTGYGVGNGTAGTATASQMQKTDVGPWVATTTATALAYRTDTTGGNSGSPVILEATGEVIGVHTHGGCGIGSGANVGTASSRSDWTTARQLVLALHTVGGFATSGQGCGGAFGIPGLTFSGIPELGQSFAVHIDSLNPANGLFGALVVGLSDAQWSGGALPASLASFGLQGCSLLVGDDATVGLMPASGSASVSYAIPGDPSWLGVSLHFQYLGLDPSSPNAVGAVASNAGAVLLGN